MSSWNSFLLALIGGIMIGLAASALLLFNGRVLGVSGILGGVLRPRPGDTDWRVAFIVGLIGGGALLAALGFREFFAPLVREPAVLIAAGLLVGFGTRVGNGCTSGHGVCGLSRTSPRSLAATLTFMAAGAATVFVVRHLIGGGT